VVCPGVPEASELSDAHTLLVLVYDVCKADALAAIPTVQPGVKPILLANKIDAEFWRKIEGEGTPHRNPVLLTGLRSSH
jgi:hypothetical protein